MNPGLTRTFIASGAITKRRIVKFATAGTTGDQYVAQAAANSDGLLGVAEAIDAADGERVDIILGGIADVEAGGTFARGDWITSDASGKAILCNPGAGTKQQCIGKAMMSAVSGDIAKVRVDPNQITTN